LQQQNLYLENIDSLIIQPQLFGDEYVLNTVSCAGKHIVTDAWRSVKRFTANSQLYDYQDLLFRDTDLFKQLSEYALNILKAFDYQTGAAHFEIIADLNGLKLIEVGFRLAGGVDHAALNSVTSTSQLNLLYDAHLQPQRFQEMYTKGVNNHKQYLRIISMVSHNSGVCTRNYPNDRILVLPSCFSLQHHLNKGLTFKQTRDLTSSPGNIYLISADYNKLQDDHAQIRRLEPIIFKNLTA